MTDPAEPGPVAVKPDPLATVRLVARRCWPWACVLAIALALLGLRLGNRVSWGDVPTWVLAVTTLLAFAAAAFAGLVAYGLLKIESARDQEAAEERAARREAEKRAQAGMVAAWYGMWHSEATHSERLRVGASSWPHWGAMIRNASDLPVYDVRITFCVAVRPGSGLDWRAGERYSSPEPILVIPPGMETAEIPDDVREREAAGENEPKWLVGILFTDADGRRWLRAPSGQLRPI